MSLLKNRSSVGMMIRQSLSYAQLTGKSVTTVQIGIKSVPFSQTTHIILLHVGLLCPLISYFEHACMSKIRNTGISSLYLA